MSGKLVGQVYERVLGHSEQAVLIAMADHANDAGEHCYPSVPYLSWKTGYTERQVQRVMARMRDMGVLIVARPASRYQPTEYRIVLNALPEKRPFRGDISAEPGVTSAPPRGDIANGRGDIGDASGVTLATPRGDISSARGDMAVSPEPSVEPTREPSEEPPREPPEQAAADAAPGREGGTFTAEVSPALVQATGFRGTVSGGKPAAWLGQCLAILGDATDDDPAAALELLQRIRSNTRWQYRKRSTAQFPDWLRSMVADLAPVASASSATPDWGWGT